MEYEEKGTVAGGSENNTSYPSNVLNWWVLFSNCKNVAKFSQLLNMVSSSSSSSIRNPSDSLLINLEILGKVLPGSKLYRDPQTNLLSIEKPRILSGAWRKWNGHGRKQTVLLISEIVKDTISCSANPLLIERTKKAATGISCLQQTYQEDLSTESELALLSHKLQAYLLQNQVEYSKKCD